MHLWSIGYESDDCSEYETSLTILIVFIFLPSFFPCPVHSSGFDPNKKEIEPTWKYPERRQVRGLNYCLGYKGSLPRSRYGKAHSCAATLLHPLPERYQGNAFKPAKKLIEMGQNMWDMMPIINKEYHPHDRRIKKNTCSFTSASVLQSQPHF